MWSTRHGDERTDSREGHPETEGDEQVLIRKFGLCLLPKC